MIKQLLCFAALIQAGISYGQTTTQWIQQASFFGVEDIKTISYVPGNTTVNPAVWTFAGGAVNTGPGGTVMSEYRLTAYNATSGTPLFDQQVIGVDIYRITYDASLDQVLLLINAEAGPAFIGQNTVSTGGDPDCMKFGLLRFNRSGVLLGSQWLPFPCSHDRAGGLVWAIDTLLQRVALSMPVYGDLDTDSTLFNFGTHSRILRKDSTYMSIFQWDYAGTPLQLDMFVQPIGISDRSQLKDITYGNNGDICLVGDIVSDIRFGSFTVSKAATETATFMARIRAGGTVAAAKKVFTGNTMSLGALGIAYNRVNKQLYFANDWSDQLVMNGSMVQHGSTGFMSNILIAATDSNLTLQRFTTVRYGDTTSTLSSLLYSFGQIQTDGAGNIVMGATMKDSFRVEQKIFRSKTANEQYNVTVIRLNKDLQLDTCMLSEGTGNEHTSQIALGQDQDIYVGGRFNGTAVFHPLSASPSTSTEDAFVVKIRLKKAGATGLPDVEETNSWSIYPSPATDKLYVSLEKMQDISLYTADGRQVYHKVWANNRNACVIDVSGLAPGVYFVRATTQNGSNKVRRFVKE